MEEILFFFGYVLFELIFWGLFYGTGYLLTPIISLGFIRPEKMEKDREKRKLKTKRFFPLIYKSDNVIYLKSDHVAGVGLLCWGLVIFGVFLYKS